ncbi:hypothetical protein PybrP1_012314 [[Pythium] brassicae (nom. inval.)]|nr:hypothetical protein PybrP1_012314 [[Pythium] brassicae (nom. inval.)]
MALYSTPEMSFSPPELSFSSLLLSASPPPPTASQPAALDPAKKRKAAEKPQGASRRKCWYAAKKNERTALEEEIRRLQADKELLELPAASRERALRKQEEESARLQQAVREQQLGPLAFAQSAISNASRTEDTPLKKYIHLSANPDERAATFRELKHCMASDAERYIGERMRFLDPTAELAQFHQYRLPNGDFCFKCLDVIPLPGYKSVRQVYERLQNFFFNMEITWTEKSGDVMLRQGEFETCEPDVASQRFLTMTPSGIQIESNTLHVSKYNYASLDSGPREDGSVGDSAVLALSTVDVDELYPYMPHDRVRQDTTGAVLLKAYPRQASSMFGESSDGGDADSSVLVVATQVYFSQMHNSRLATHPDCTSGAIFGRNFCSRTMLGVDS